MSDINKYRSLNKNLHYDILRDKYKFKKINDFSWYRKIFTYEYFFNYSTFNYNAGTLEFTIKKNNNIIKNELIYDDIYLKEILIKYFPQESRFEKLKNII